MYKNIMLTIDLTDESSWKKALPTAVEYCQAFGSTLHVLAVVPDFGMNVVGQHFPDNFADEVVDQSRKQLLTFTEKNVPAGIDVRNVIAYGSIYKEILASAGNVDADLIVIASHRPELKDYLLGPNAARVVRHAGCSVLVVRD